MISMTSDYSQDNNIFIFMHLTKCICIEYYSFGVAAVNVFSG